MAKPIVYIDCIHRVPIYNGLWVCSVGYPTNCAKCPHKEGRYFGWEEISASTD